MIRHRLPHCRVPYPHCIMLRRVSLGITTYAHVTIKVNAYPRGASYAYAYAYAYARYAGAHDNEGVTARPCSGSLTEYILLTTFFDVFLSR